MNAYKLAYGFCAKELGDETTQLHSECVIDACMSMCKDTDFNKDIFAIAGWLHDIARKKNTEKHHEAALEYVDKFLAMHPEYLYIKEEIVDCIRNHRSDGNPRTIYGLVFKAANKVAMRNLKWLETKHED